MVKALQIVDEEEQFIFLDRATDVAAQCSCRRDVLRMDRIVASIKVVASKELVSGTVKVVAAGLEDNVGYGAAGSAEFRIEVAGGDVDGLDCFEGRDEDLEQPGALVVVNSLDLIVVAHAELAVDFRLQGTAALKNCECWNCGARRAGDEIKRFWKLRFVPSGMFCVKNSFELASGVGALGPEE